MSTTDLPKPSVEEFSHIVTQRRATQHFTSDPVPHEVLDTALALAGQAPSGFNFQPWRFLVVRDPARREALKKASYNQPKIGEAPVMIIAFASKEGWKSHIDEISDMAGKRRGMSSQQIQEQKKKATESVAQKVPEVWLTKQVMIAFTTLMLAIEAQGWDTAPMEGFVGTEVVRAFNLPADTEVVALLAVGRAKGAESPHPGRLPVSDIAFDETVETPWKSSLGGH